MVDKFSDVLVVESLALGIDRFKVTIVELLKELLAQDGISIRGVYEAGCELFRKRIECAIMMKAAQEAPQ